MYNDRSLASKDFCPCDGNDTIDGNEEVNGYPCRDQIGRGPFDSETEEQTVEPWYIWNNSHEGEDLIVHLHDDGLNQTHIKENRDYYLNISRPYYTPYVYPHPLTINQNADIEFPSTPENLSGEYSDQTQIQISWDAATDNVGVVGYRIYKNGILIDTSYTTSYIDSDVENWRMNNYAVAAFDATGNAGIPCKPIDISATNSINSLASIAKFNIHPNPAKEITNIEFFLKTPSVIKISIIKLTGQVVEEFVARAYNPGKHQIAVGTKKIGKGIYLIQFQTGNNTISKKLIIK
jgi:hypothetical protein